MTRRGIVGGLAFLAVLNLGGIVVAIVAPARTAPCRTHACGQPAVAPGTPGLTP